MARILRIWLIAGMLATGLFVQGAAIPNLVLGAGSHCSGYNTEVDLFSNSNYNDNPYVPNEFLCINSGGYNDMTQQPFWCYHHITCTYPNLIDCPRSFIDAGLDQGTWNDCVSSIKFYAASCHYGVWFYQDTYLGGNVDWASWGTNSISALGGIGGAGPNDAISSFHVVYRSTCPLSPTG